MTVTQKARMTTAEVMAQLATDSPANKARRQFSSWSAKIEQASQQRDPISPIELRRMEFEAVDAIVTAFLEPTK